MELEKAGSLGIVPSKVRSRANTFPAVKRWLLSASSGSCLHYELSRDIRRQSLSLLSTTAIVLPLGLDDAGCLILVSVVLTIIHLENPSPKVARARKRLDEMVYSLELSEPDRIGHDNLRYFFCVFSTSVR